jgi:hypothetical protein
MSAVASVATDAPRGDEAVAVDVGMVVGMVLSLTGYVARAAGAPAT